MRNQAQHQVALDRLESADGVLGSLQAMRRTMTETLTAVLTGFGGQLAAAGAPEPPLLIPPAPAAAVTMGTGKQRVSGDGA